MEMGKMDISKKAIEEKGKRILTELNRIYELVEKERQTREKKIEMKKRLNGCMDSFRLLLFDLTTE